LKDLQDRNVEELASITITINSIFSYTFHEDVDEFAATAQILAFLLWKFDPSIPNHPAHTHVVYATLQTILSRIMSITYK
jgi:hypothetical protein